jgi:N-formylglutamate amidohydrolase
MLPFLVRNPSSKKIPIVISVPHCGTAFPDELKDQYKQDLIKNPDDTDWFVDRLYDFAPGLGMTMISAQYSRWVIDLNRDPESKPLYTDGRIITGLCPTTNFLGENIYNDERTEVDPIEIKRRLEKYYLPYHQQLKVLLDQTKAQFGTVLLWDCHSIRQSVPTIYSEKFPDLILGSADQRSASQSLISLALNKLQQSSFSVEHNHPFKGGYITRQYGRPDENFNALQLEMSKVNYMDDAEENYDDARAENVREVLISALGALAQKISS